MVKKPAKRMAKATRPKAPKSRPKEAVAMKGNLDQASRDYAALLADPCNAQLTRTVWPGAGGSFVSRFETDFIMVNDAISTGGALVYSPGFGAGPNASLGNSVACATDTTGFNLTAPQPAPGTSFLATVDLFRPVAACAEIYWPGTELNRSGIVALGVVDTTVTTVFSTGLNCTLAKLRSFCQHTERMPVDKATVNWRPGASDSDAAGSSTTISTGGRMSLLLVASGFPINTGVRIRIVVAMEWWPQPGTGFVSSVPKSVTTYTANDVLTYLDRTGNWLFNTYKRYSPIVNNVARAVSYGAKTFGPAMLAIA